MWSTSAQGSFPIEKATKLGNLAFRGSSKNQKSPKFQLGKVQNQGGGSSEIKKVPSSREHQRLKNNNLFSSYDDPKIYHTKTANKQNQNEKTELKQIKCQLFQKTKNVISTMSDIARNQRKDVCFYIQKNLVRVRSASIRLVHIVTKRVQVL